MQHKVSFPQVSEGQLKGYGLHPIYCNSYAPENGVSPATHAYHTHQARHRTGRTAQKNTYEGRVTKPNMLVAKFGASKKAIEDAAWASGRGTMGKHYCVVSAPLCVYIFHFCFPTSGTCLIPQLTPDFND